MKTVQVYKNLVIVPELIAGVEGLPGEYSFSEGPGIPTRTHHGIWEIKILPIMRTKWVSLIEMQYVPWPGATPEEQTINGFAEMSEIYDRILTAIEES